MSNWQPGDTAQIIADRGIEAKYEYVIGNTCRLRRYVGQKLLKTGVFLNDAWEVEMFGNSWWVSESVLRKPYDPFEPGSWEDMKDIWEPKELEVVV